MIFERGSTISQTPHTLEQAVSKWTDDWEIDDLSAHHIYLYHAWGIVNLQFFLIHLVNVDL